MAQTVDQVFQSKKLWTWYNSPPTKFFDGSSEKGEDFSTTFGSPVGVPVGGRVLRIVHHTNSIGDVVEIQASDGSVWLYQHITVKVKVGDTLQCGDVVGTENGLPIDQYSTGPHIEVRYAKPGTWKSGTDSWFETWVNPRSIFSGVGKTIPEKVSSNLVSTLTNAITTLVSGNNNSGSGTVNIQLAPSADVTALLWAIDQTLALVNPFDVPNATTDNISLAGASISFTDPVSWVEGFGLNLMDDLSAVVVRAILVIIGVVIIFKVVSNFIDFGAIAKTVGSGVQTAAAIGALA